MNLPKKFFAAASLTRLALLTLLITVAVLSVHALFLTPGLRAATTIQNSTPVVSVSAASYAGGAAPVAPNSIIAAFGTQLARATEAATTQPLPVTLAGTSVKVTDSAGVERVAQLFFVSAFQINYLIPDSTANGEAQVTITSVQANGDQVISRGRVRVSAKLESAGSLLIVVADTGVGIDPEDLARVLRPFEQVESPFVRERGGAGLGLPIAKGLMQGHGGTLTIESWLGGGTIVTCRFPPSRIHSSRTRLVAG